jgi:hypothetical protein
MVKPLDLPWLQDSPRFLQFADLPTYRIPMALAILRLEDTDPTRHRFQINIGTNRFYRYAIGKNTKLINGLVQLEEQKFVSPLMGPISEASLGKALLDVPRDRFDRQDNCIQLTSFKTMKLEGIAISNVVRVVTKLSDAVPGKRASSLSLDWSVEYAMDKTPIETVPFSYREEPPVSSAMFLGAITALIPKILPTLKTVLPKVANTVAEILPTALPLVGNIIGSVTGGAAGGIPTPEGDVAPATGGSPLLQAITNPNTAQLIASLLQQATGKAGAAGAAPGSSAGSLAALLQQLTGAAAGAAPTAISQSLALPLPTLTAPPLLAGRVADRPLPCLTAPSPYAREQAAEQFSEQPDEELKERSSISFYTPPRSAPTDVDRTLNSTAYALDLPPQYVHEMAIPVALLTMLPALMPLLEKALNPETLKTLMDNMPVNKLMGTVTDGLKQVGGMIQESEQRRFNHLEKIMPRQTTAGDINQMFQGMSLSLAVPPSTLKYQRVEAVRLKFDSLTTLMLHGRSRLLYHQERTIAFPLSITTPRPIQNATLELLVKNPATLEILIEQKYPVEQVSGGALTVVPQLSPERLRSLTANEEYLVCVTLVWSGKSKQTQEKTAIGTSMSQIITLVKDCCFDRIEGSSEIVPLNDVDKFRPYWHKVWQGSFSKSLRRFKFDCKYYYVLESDRPNHARIETLIQALETKGSQQSNRLKSGLAVSPSELNALLGQIAKQPPLDAAQLNALSAPEFKARFSHAARTQVEFEGNSGESAALWVYPEVKLQQVILKKIVQVNKNGHVTELSEQTVKFPMPSVAHFIGVKT